MKIDDVEKYQAFELGCMPYISQMLFPCKPEPSAQECGKSIHPLAKINIGNCRLRRVWLARRSFVAMEAIHNMVRHHTHANGIHFSTHEHDYIILKFFDYLHRHGGWLNLGQDAAYDCMEDMRSLTFRKAVDGFLSGHVLKYVLENLCSVDEASAYVADNVIVEDYFQDTGEYSSALLDPMSGSAPYKYKIGEKRYKNSHIKQNVWSEMKNVSYAWAAAVDLFKDPSTFTHKMISFANPFESSELDTSSPSGYAKFVILAKHYHSLATSRRRSSKGYRSPLIKGHGPNSSRTDPISPPFLFD